MKDWSTEASLVLAVVAPLSCAASLLLCFLTVLGASAGGGELGAAGH